jgi:hypothetical protein
VDAAKETLKLPELTVPLAEIWELCHSFDLFSGKIGIVASESITDSFKQAVKKQSSATFVPVTKKSQLDLVIYHHSIYPISENETVALIESQLPLLAASQKEGSRMLIQLQNTLTQNSIQTICSLGASYQTVILIKASITSSMSQSQYLLLDGYRSKKSSAALSRAEIPESIIREIQIHNSQVLPARLELYRKILRYLTAGFFAGVKTLELKTEQELRGKEWIQDMVRKPEDVLQKAKDRYRIARDTINPDGLIKMEYDLE